MTGRAPSDNEVLRALTRTGREVVHTVNASGLHTVEIRWQGGWSYSRGAHAEYSIALRVAFVGMTPFLTKRMRAERVKALTPKRLHHALLVAD